jgi:O-antigen/teichoic acid export membrane protein
VTVFQKLRDLLRNLAIYGLGDIATSLIGFLLLPIYTDYLSQTAFGVLALIGVVEAVAKIVFRWGLDGSFMRYYYECPDQAARQRLASTIFWFLILVNGGVVLLGLALVPRVSGPLFGTPGHGLTLALVLVNTFALSVTFIPFHVLRILEKSREFSVLTVSRSLATVVLRLVLVVGLGLGVLGIVVADLVVTGAMTLVLARWFAPLIRPVFSRALLAESLRFGLPRLPHGAAQQAMAVGDRAILKLFVSTADIGLYSIGATFGLALKLFLSAFEYAWAPFYYATVKNEPDAPKVLGAMTTYVVAFLALLAAGLAALAHDVVPLMTAPEYAAAAAVVPWIALGVVFQGIYLLTSIGLNITRKTAYYPVSTAIAAAVSIALNFALVPRYGIIGAAWANTAAYATLAGTAFQFSRRVYPIPYEWGRLSRVAAAASAAYLASNSMPPVAPVAALALRGSVVCVVYVAVLGLSGFFHPGEIDRLRRVAQRTPRRQALAEPPVETAELAGQIVAVDLPEEAPGRREAMERIT